MSWCVSSRWCFASDVNSVFLRFLIGDGMRKAAVPAVSTERPCLRFFSRRTCLMRESDARKASYFLANFLIKFLFLLNFFRSSTDMRSKPICSACGASRDVKNEHSDNLLTFLTKRRCQRRETHPSKPHHTAIQREKKDATLRRPLNSAWNLSAMLNSEKILTLVVSNVDVEYPYSRTLVM